MDEGSSSQFKNRLNDSFVKVVRLRVPGAVFMRDAAKCVRA